MPTSPAQFDILIIDSDRATVEPLRDRLLELRCSVLIEVDGRAALARIDRDPPDLLIVDWSIPGFAALDIFRKVRSVKSLRPIRIIILSALTGENAVVTGLENGADDYIVKPYSVREAAARVSAVLRSLRTRDSHEILTYDELELDVSTNRVSARGHVLGLRSIEFRLLEFLMTHAGRTFDREQLLANVWGKNADVDVRTVDVNVQRLRRILTEPGYEEYIQTVRGFGYRFAAPSGR